MLQLALNICQILKLEYHLNYSCPEPFQVYSPVYMASAAWFSFTHFINVLTTSQLPQAERIRGHFLSTERVRCCCWFHSKSASLELVLSWLGSLWIWEVYTQQLHIKNELHMWFVLGCSLLDSFSALVRSYFIRSYVQTWTDSHLLAVFSVKK